MGIHASGARQHGDDVAADDEAGFHAQKKSLIAREQNEEHRAAWRAEMQTVDAGNLIFLDETSTPLTLTPLRARALRGERAVGRVPRRRWTNVTLVSSVTASGMGPSLLIEGAADRLVFDAFVEHLLVPTLRPGQTVVLDNLSIHKSAFARQLIEAAGCTMRFLPTYSPDLNPIEPTFSKIKTVLRRAEARTLDDLEVATKVALNLVTAANAQGCYRHAGYAFKEQLL